MADVNGGGRGRHLRIDFVVKEVGPDGADVEDARFVRFGDDVDHAGLRDFFDRCRDGLGLMFGTCVASVVELDDAGPNKISLIKELRALTGWGLCEAKDMVERGTGVAIAAFSDARRAADAASALRGVGATPRVRPAKASDEVRPSGLPPLAWPERVSRV